MDQFRVNPLTGIPAMGLLPVDLQGILLDHIPDILATVLPGPHQVNMASLLTVLTHPNLGLIRMAKVVLPGIPQWLTQGWAAHLEGGPLTCQVKDLTLRQWLPVIMDHNTMDQA